MSILKSVLISIFLLGNKEVRKQEGTYINFEFY